MVTINQALSVRSDHSIGESIMQIDTVVSRAKEFGFESVALTDTMTISGMVPFTNKCKKEGIKPVIGCTLRIYEDPTYRKPGKSSGEKEKPNPFYQIKVYVRNDAGLRGLLKLLSKGNSAEYFYYHARVGLNDVLNAFGHEDVIVTTGDMFNVFHHPDHVAIVAELSAKFSTMVELCPIDTPLFDTLNLRAVQTARALDIGTVASYPFFYGSSDDSDTLDVLRAITTNAKMDSRFLPIPFTRDWSFDSPVKLVHRMHALGKRIGLSGDEVVLPLKRMQTIPDSCSYEFKKLEPSLPKMAEDEFTTLVERCKDGWAKRFAQPVLGHKPTDLTEYKARLTYELGVLKKLGFANYFLVVQDIVNWSKENGVIVGPGRGSVGGSLIAYLMGITDVDPIRFSLLFERFINPERIDLPDADLDFMSSRRGEVVSYITNRYGSENVAGISNYSTLGPASAMRDVSRVHNLDPLTYACSKQVEKEHGKSLSLEESAATVPDIAKFKAGYPTIWKHATKLEGCMRNLGQHAAGVIVAGEPIINRAVLMNRDEDALPVVSWDKQVVEDWGLIKMDILGLSTLDVLEAAQTYIRQRHGKRVNFLSIPLDEPDVMGAFGRGDTVGVFQFEGAGMRKLLKELAEVSPLTFEDIAAATALYRPGPIDAGLVDKFVAVKQGKMPITYDHPSMRPALENTYGVITYQEQVMQVCRDLAGFTFPEADHVRKAMGKKDKVKMAEWRIRFVAGAVKSGMTEAAAENLWNDIEGFAGYAFNKSHAVEYSVISYWTMWLKVRYPAEFFAAAMTVADKDDKLTALVMDARRAGLEVRPPDINKSSNRIEIDGERVLYAPFQAVKGISNNVANHIVAVRARMIEGVLSDDGVLLRAPKVAFESKTHFEDMVSVVKLGSKINKSHREKLERVGAFASVEPTTRPALHIDRLKDRIELMPGFTVDAVKADRKLNDERVAKLKIIEVLGETRTCEACSLKGTDHPTPRLGSNPKFMIVFDSPSWKEGVAGKMLEGDIGKYMRAALSEVDLSFNDGYFTSLVKAPKDKDEKGLTMEQINGCSHFLAKEIEILKPAVIVAMGSNATRYFAPGIKGAPADLAGKVIFRPDLDASIVFGLNPSSIFYDGSKVRLLQDVCAKLAELVLT